MSTPYDGKIAVVYWKPTVVKENSIAEIVETLRNKAPNIGAIFVKTSNGVRWQGAGEPAKPDMQITGPDALARWIDECTAVGIDVHAWCVPNGVHVAEEADLIAAACQVDGLKSMIFDVEVGVNYWRGGSDAVSALCERIRGQIPEDFHLGVCSDARGYHPRDVYLSEWTRYTNSLHPMVYHQIFGLSPEVAITNAFNALAQFDRPIIPMLQGYRLINPNDALRAAHAAFEGHNAPGVSYFRFGTLKDEDFAAIKRIARPTPENPPSFDFTNRELLDAIVAAASCVGEDPQSWIRSSGLEALSNQPNEPYSRVPISELPGLDQHEKRLIERALAGEALEFVDDIVGHYTNQDVINAFYRVADQIGQPDGGWDLIEQAEMTHLADHRWAPYAGPPIRELPNLSGEIKQRLLETLSTMPRLLETDALPVPWTSQLDADSEFANDCGQACVLMLLNAYDLAADDVTVEALTRILFPNMSDAELKEYCKQHGKTGAGDLQQLADHYTLTLEPHRVMKDGAVDTLRHFISQKKAAIILVNYADLDFPLHLVDPPGVDQGWHWLLVIGDQDGEFVVHDSLWTPWQSPRPGKGGNGRTIEHTTLGQAIVELNSASNTLTPATALL